MENIYGAIAAFAAAEVLVLLLAWYIIERSIARPIRKIGAVATRLAGGNNEARVGQLVGFREISMLGRSIDTMAAAIQASGASRGDAIKNLEETHALLNAVIGSSPAAIICLDSEGRVVLWSPAAERIFGWTAAEVQGKPYPVVPNSEQDQFAAHFRLTMGGGTVVGARASRMKKDGTLVEAMIHTAPLRDENGETTGIQLAIVNDVSQQALTERELQQAQKMEAVGKLTGGVAHDFNNLLAIAIGNLDLAKEGLGSAGRLPELVDAALNACLRGADLTRRLLAFSRQQPLRPCAVAPGEAVQMMMRLLGNVLGEQVTVRLHVEDGLWRVVVDPTQLETTMLNLAVNARDAMPDGGILSIALRNTRLDEDFVVEHPGMLAGDYVEIAVSDTGIGMASEVAGRVFEPFFTTKESGTGLGLSMVYGFIKQSDGHIKIYSEPGVGTVIKLWLPRVVDGRDPGLVEPVAMEATPCGDEMVLVVEDNAAIRKVVVRQLEDLGYRTVEAGHAEEALGILQERKDVDVLFTDIVMPGGRNGRVLADEALALRPGLKVLFTSGFAHQVGGGDPATVPLLSKPYRKQQLAEALRQVLGGRLG